ncbi:patatin-like phospholipase family protein [Variovorax robiniae]|uniref:Patatin-like phospholipase family protein n=1 Tax=Variovorax robiniae TaxID=1836199 RepID=A0ABU8XHB0_9BURK
MRAVVSTFWTLVCATSLMGCQVISFQPSEAERNVAFPLAFCTDGNLELAEVRNRGDATQGKQQSTEPGQVVQGLGFSKDDVCVSRPNDATPAVKVDLPYEQKVRRVLEEPFLPTSAKNGDRRPALGIALSGGGSKASAFGVGVLAGLADHGMLDTADYISSVSGGSYAAYFYYSHRIFPMVRDRPQHELEQDTSTAALFRDCIQVPKEARLTGGVRKKIEGHGICEGLSLLPMGSASVNGLPSNRYQAFLRCQQDVLYPGRCSNITDRGLWGSMGPRPLLGTIALIPVNLISGGLFDWGLNISQAAHTYRRGIGMAYGTTVANVQELAPDGQAGINDGQTGFNKPVGCTEGSNLYAMDCHRGVFLASPQAMTYPELLAGLHKAKGTSKPLPFWIINATAARSRSVRSWWAPSNKDVDSRDLFEMTAVSHGSSRWGVVSAPASLHNMNVLDSVAASAAFLDANQFVVSGPTKGVIGVGIRFANLDWGSDIANYNVSDGRRSVHKVLPFPLNYADAFANEGMGKHRGDEVMLERERIAFIRLIDGGNSENFGLFALIRRGVKTIVVSDAGQDIDGLFEDLCGFKNRLSNFKPETLHMGAGPGSKMTMHVPGLSEFDTHCGMIKPERDEDAGEPPGKRGGYSVRDWRLSFPVLLGCIRLSKPEDISQPCSNLKMKNDIRLLIVKPAIDVERVLSAQTNKGLPEDGLAGPPDNEVKRWTVTSCSVPGEPARIAAETSAAQRNDSSLLNCESLQYLLIRWDMEKGPCQGFPQHKTWTTTYDSSPVVYSAYRELGRQYLSQAAKLLSQLTKDDPDGVQMFERLALLQGQKEPLQRGYARLGDSSTNCLSAAKGPWPQPESQLERRPVAQ